MSDFNKSKYKILLTVFVGFLSIVSFAQALTGVYLRTNNAYIIKGDIINVDLKISSDKSINTIDGTLIYDKNKLFVKEVKTDGSLFSIWAKQPSFDNNKGEISFVGGIPGGFVGKEGQVLKITFLAKNLGDVKVDFKDIFSVLLNDGLGTPANPWVEPLSLSIYEKRLENIPPSLGQQLPTTSKAPAIFIILSILIIIVIFIKIRLNKRRA